MDAGHLGVTSSSATCQLAASVSSPMNEVGVALRVPEHSAPGSEQIQVNFSWCHGYILLAPDHRSCRCLSWGNQWRTAGTGLRLGRELRPWGAEARKGLGTLFSRNRNPSSSSKPSAPDVLLKGGAREKTSKQQQQCRSGEGAPRNRQRGSEARGAGSNQRPSTCAVPEGTTLNQHAPLHPSVQGSVPTSPSPGLSPPEPTLQLWVRTTASCLLLDSGEVGSPCHWDRLPKQGPCRRVGRL